MILYLRSGFIKLALLLQLFFVPLEVLDHQVFACELKMVAIVINPLVRLQMKMVQYFVNGVPFYPKDVPVLSSNTKHCQIQLSWE